MAAYGLTLVTAPTVEPVTLAEAKKQCEIAASDAAHDLHLARLITAARQYYEDHTNRAVCTQTWDFFVDEFPDGDDPILLPKSPLQSITSIKYYDTDGVQQTWSSANYIVSVSREPGRVRLAPTIVYPSIQYRADAVVVRFVCGYGAASAVPEQLKAGMLLLIGHWFENRTDVVVAATVASVPRAVDAIADHYRLGDEFTVYAECE